MDIAKHIATSEILAFTNGSISLSHVQRCSFHHFGVAKDRMHTGQVSFAHGVFDETLAHIVEGKSQELRTRNGGKPRTRGLNC